MIAFVSPDPFSLNSVRGLLFYNQEKNLFLSSCPCGSYNSKSLIWVCYYVQYVAGLQPPCLLFVSEPSEHVAIQTSIHPSIHAWTCTQTATIINYFQDECSKKEQREDVVFVNVGIKFSAITRCTRWFPMSGAHLQLESTCQCQVTL